MINSMELNETIVLHTIWTEHKPQTVGFLVYVIHACLQIPFLGIHFF